MAISANGEMLADTPHLTPQMADLAEELKELVRRQARLPQDRGQGAALHDAMLRDNGYPALLVPIHRMAALGTHINESD
jgi:hypothetical protein